MMVLKINKIRKDYFSAFGPAAEYIEKYWDYWEEYSQKIANWGRDTRPVINVSWFDAVKYCNWLSEKEGLHPSYTKCNEHPGNFKLYDSPENVKGYRLLTENEWEYVARGGRQGEATKFAGSKVLNTVGWFYQSSEGETKPVGQKKPNELGLYDMSGNVWEWVYTENYSEICVKRGGSWINHENCCKVNFRDSELPYISSSIIGFRICKTK